MRISTDIILSWVRNKSIVTKPLFITAVIALLVISSCSKDSGEHGTGGISFTLKIPQTESQATQFKAAQFPCEDNGIVSVEANVYSSQEILVATGGPWPCTEGEGTITAVEEGEGYTVHVSLRDDNSNVLFRGSKGGINVQAGMTTDAGEITLTAANNPPVFQSVENKQVGEGQFLSFQIIATDPDEDTLTYSSVSLPIGATFDPGTQQFYWIPTLSQGGTHTASFQVTDDGVPALSDTLDVTITVGNVNHPPVLTVPSGPVHFSLGVPYSFTVSATDPDGEDTLTYDIAYMPWSPFNAQYITGPTFDPANRMFTWPYPDDSSIGEYKVLFRVTDNGSPRMSDYEWVTVQVYDSISQLNDTRYPILSPIGPKQTALGQQVQFTISATDPDNNPLTYDQPSPIPPHQAPQGYTYGNFQFSWSSNTPGNYWIQFSVRDTYDYTGYAILDTVHENVIITVGDVNRPPVLNPIGRRRIENGDTLQFVITATDPENNSLTYTAARRMPNGSLTTLPQGATFDPATQTFTWNVVDIVTGDYPVRFTVTDNGTPAESEFEDVVIHVD